MLGSQSHKLFGGSLLQVNRCPFGKAVIACHDEAQPLFGKDKRFQAIIGEWHRCDDHDVQRPSPHLVEQRRRPALLECERDIGIGGQKCVQQQRHVARAAAMAEAERDATSIGIDDLLEVLSGRAEVSQRLLCGRQERAAGLGRNDPAPARLHQRSADRIGQATHHDADRRLRHSQPLRGSSHVLLLNDGDGDREVGTDQAEPIIILIKHIRKSIGLINS